MKKILNFWKFLTSGSVNRKILGSAIIVALGTGFVKFVSVAKELVVAWKFGTGDDLDAFLMALIVPSFIINVVAGSLNAAFIPTYIRVREQEGKPASQQLFSGVMFCTIGLLILVTMVMLVTAKFYLPLIASGFSAKKLNLTFQLFYLMTPIIVINGIEVIWGAVLNAGEKFALVALLPIITPTLSALFLLTNQSWGVSALAFGLVCGFILESLVIGLALKRQGIKLLPRWYGFDQNLRQVIEQYVPMIAGSFLMSSTSIIDQSMAAMLLPGSVSALNYGNRVIALPINLLSTSLSTAVIPYFSKMVATENWLGVQHTLNRYLVLIGKLTVPLTCFFFFFSQQIILILFKRGSFSTEDVNVVAQVQSFLALQIPFYVGGVFIVRLISAIRYNHILMWGCVINCLSNVIFNIIFIKIWGVAGIALSTSLVYAISFCFLFGFWLRFSTKVAKIT